MTDEKQDEAQGTPDEWRSEYGWRPEPHPRQAEIDKHPRPISISGVGNELNLGGREGQ